MEITRIIDQNFHPAAEWGTRNRRNGYFTVLRQRIRRFLERLSGNDITAMINDILTKHEVIYLQNKYIQTLRGISQAVNNKNIVKSKSKHHFIRPARHSGLSCGEIRELGFICSDDLWESCVDINERHLGGRPRIVPELINEINEHMENITNIAANRTVVIRSYAERNPRILFKKRKIAQRVESVRYRTTTLNDAFRQYKLLNNNLNDQRRNFRFSTFKYYIDKRFKKPFRHTDLCDYCEFGKKLEKELRTLFTGYNFGDFVTNESWREKFFFIAQRPLNNPRENLLINDASVQERIADLKLIEFHKSIADRQRKSYNKQRLNVDELNGKILIEIDYKQKINLGEGPRQLGSEYFVGYKKVNCLGFGIFYVDRSDAQNHFINSINFDIISDYHGQEAIDVIIIFEHILTRPEFQMVDEIDYIIWTDCGKQFRCAEFIFFLFNTLAEKGKRISLNFFAEKHGIKI
jgi:hypothetical protein